MQSGFYLKRMANRWKKWHVPVIIGCYIRLMSTFQDLVFGSGQGAQDAVRMERILKNLHGEKDHTPSIYSDKGSPVDDKV